MAQVHGNGVTPYGAVTIADDYRLAADALGLDHRTRSAMPRRLLYLHALEGYLRAFLLLIGHSPDAIRHQRHDLQEMLTLGEAGGLRVSKNSRRFIEAAAAEGDYVRVRYDTGLDYRGGDWPPPPRPNASLQRLIAAVEDVQKAVRAAVVNAVVKPSVATD